MAIIDSHQHFWNYDPERHGWINDRMSVLKRDFLPHHLEKELQKTGVDGCISVQADQTEKETQYLLDLAGRHDFILGVVGWLDLRSDRFEERLAHFMKDEALLGLRHIVQDEPDDRFLLRTDFMEGIATLGRHDLPYDILIHARHLPVATEFCSKFPDQKFVLDHIAKPRIADHAIAEWENGIRELAGHPELYCKLSGMVTEADWEHWETTDFKPYLDVVFDAFGTDRLMFGSDWPVCKLAADYDEVFRLIAGYLEQFSGEERANILGGNAIRCYGLKKLLPDT